LYTKDVIVKVEGAKVKHILSLCSKCPRARMQARGPEHHCLTASSMIIWLKNSFLRSDATSTGRRHESGCGTHAIVMETEKFYHRYLKINNSIVKEYFLAKFGVLSEISEIYSESSARNVVRVR